MADLQPYRFEPGRFPNPGDSESENEEVNDQLDGTFWCSCERCQESDLKALKVLEIDFGS